MTKKINLALKTMLCAGFMMTLIPAFGQNIDTSDSLTLNYILKTSISNHPAIKLEEQSIAGADAKIALANSTYYPNIEASASYTRIGPAPAMEFGGMMFELSKADIFDSKVSIIQNLYDFGKTSANIDYANKNKEMAVLSIEQIKQKISSIVISNFYLLNYLQEGIRIKDEQIKTLNEHLNSVQKKKDAGSATDYEILTTKVRISTVENQRTDLVSMQKTQLAILNSLLGLPATKFHTVKDNYDITAPTLSYESLSQNAENNRPELKLLEQKIKLTKLQYNIFDNQMNPTFNLFAQAGFKNNNEPDLGKIVANYVAGIEVKFPIFDGERSKNNLMLANASIESAKYEAEVAKRNISTEVVDCNANVDANLKKIEQSKLQLHQAEEAFKLAKINFQAGGITNIELLDAETSVSEVRLVLTKAKIDYVLSVYKLKIALGDKLY